jgi:hypothetical protein
MNILDILAYKLILTYLKDGSRLCRINKKVLKGHRRLTTNHWALTTTAVRRLTY